MKLTNDQLNTIALNMIYCSKCRRIQKLGKAILKLHFDEIKVLYKIFRFEFMIYSDA